MPKIPGRATPLFAVLAGCLLLVSALVLFFEVRSFLGHLESRLAVGGHGRLQAMSQQMEALRGRFNGILAESIEVRLKALEKNLAAGKVGADDLRAFEELQKDIAILERYAGSGGPAVLNEAGEHDRFRALRSPQPGIRDTDLVNEVAELKHLFYFCLAGLATGTGMMLGYYWVNQRRCLRAHRVPLLTPPESDLSG